MGQIDLSLGQLSIPPSADTRLFWDDIAKTSIKKNQFGCFIGFVKFILTDFQLKNFKNF
jgi:hypothetical protein